MRHYEGDKVISKYKFERLTATADEYKVLIKSNIITETSDGANPYMNTYKKWYQESSVQIILVKGDYIYYSEGDHYYRSKSENHPYIINAAPSLFDLVHEHKLVKELRLTISEPLYFS